MQRYRKVKPGSIVEIDFDTMASATGAPITMTGLAVADVTQIKIYKDGSTTERASSAGFALLDTDGIDFDGLTGIHGFTIDLANNTTAGFYSAGSRYRVVVTGLTVDGQTVRFTADTFVIGYDNTILDTTIATLASQTSFTLTTGPAEDDALKGCVLPIHDIASAVQMAMVTVLSYTGATKTVTLAAAPTFTIAAGDNVSAYPRTNLYSVGGEVATEGDLETRLDDVDAELLLIKDSVGYLLAREAGACASPQTTTPSYAITAMGATYTVNMAVTNSTGVRTAPSLVKT